MNNLGEWMNSILVAWGVPMWLADVVDETLIALLILLVAIGSDKIGKRLLMWIMERYTKRSLHLWSMLLIKRRVVHHFISVFPALLIYYLLPWAFVEGQVLLMITRKACVVYIIIELLLTFNALLLVTLDVHSSRSVRNNRPMKSFVQVIQVLLFFVGGIIIISVLVDKSPMSLFAGLGASAAVLMLVFKDSILGFVAGIQLSANDMLRIGDWVQLPGGVANGIVEEITLNTVKIRNWDKTISTIPPYSLVNNSFMNWRGMQESNGRRVNKQIFLDMHTLKFFTPEMLDKLRTEVPLLADFQPCYEEIPTNAQLYRIYIERYLCSLPLVNQDMDMIISQKEPTTYGVPIQVYFFLREKAWHDYEHIQSDIFDHLLVMVQKFDLKLYQYS